MTFNCKRPQRVWIGPLVILLDVRWFGLAIGLWVAEVSQVENHHDLDLGSKHADFSNLYFVIVTQR